MSRSIKGAKPGVPMSPINISTTTMRPPGCIALLQALRDDYASLSRREREVMALVVAGLLNKQVGWELGISEITVKAHRGRMMRKMQATSLTDLVKMAAALRLAPALRR